MLHKLSPSSLTFLYDSCPRCFYNAVRNGWNRPYSPMPSVFTTIDKCMRSFFSGKNLADYIPGVPSGTVLTATKRVKSAELQIPGVTSSCFFSGQMDAIVSFNDGTVGIIDFKTSEPSASTTAMYARQLHAYRSIVENPASGIPQKVSRMGLVSVSPRSMDLDGRKAFFSMEMSFTEVAIDDEWWSKFLAEILSLLDGDMPAMPDKCDWCVLQQAKQQLLGELV